MNAPATALITDEEALGRVARGDGSALAIVFDRHADDAIRYARRLVRDTAAAEDAVHDAFVGLIGAVRAGTFSADRGTARAWIFRAVRNASVDTLRRRARESGTPPQPLTAATGSDSELREDFEVALARLTEPQRSALLLRVDGQLSYAEIATVLGATLAQVKTWIFRARVGLAGVLLTPAARTF